MTNKVSFQELQPIVSEASKKYGVPEEYVWNVIRGENSGSVKGAQALKEVRTDAVSPKDARGIMQMTPIALKDVTDAGLVPSGIDHTAMSTRDQIFTGTAYLSRLLQLSQKPEEVYAMYNYGPKARFRMDSLPAETRGYLQKTGATPTATKGPSMDTQSLIQALLQTAGMQNQAIQTGGQQLQEMQARSAALHSQGTQEQVAVVADAAAVAMQKAATQYKQAKKAEALQALFNLNPEEVNNEIRTSLTEAAAAKSARAPIRAEFDAASAINPLANPLDYIFAQLKLPQLAAQNNALADKEDEALQNIATKTKLLQDSQAALTANTADEIHKQTLESVQVAARESLAKLKIEEAKHMSGTAANMLQQINLANMLGDNNRQALIGAANLQSAEENRALRQEQQLLLSKEKSDAAEQERIMDDRLLLLSSTLGRPEPWTQKRLRALRPQERETLIDNALNGYFGPTLQSSIEFFRDKHNPVALQASNQSLVKTAELLERAGAAYQKEATRENQKSIAAGGPKLDAVALRAKGFDLYKLVVVDSMASTSATDDLSSSKWDTEYNPYVGHWVGYAQSNAPKDNLVTKAIEALSASGVVKGEDLTAEQRKQVVASVLETNDVKKASKDVAAFFRGLAARNLELNKYTMFSLPPQRSYVFTLPGETFKDNARKVDLLQPGLVENAATWRARQRAFPTIENLLNKLPIGQAILTVPGAIVRKNLEGKD